MKNPEIQNNPESQAEIEKPAVLYHASQNPDIEEFTPRRDRIRDKDEGPRVFASPDKSLVTTFLVKGHCDDWTNIGKFNGVPCMVICADREKFIEDDKGGTLYELPSDTFSCDLEKGMGKDEWTSKEPVKPTNKIKFDSALEAMLENGVQVYFVDKETFKSIVEDERNYGGFEIIKNLTSENQNRGINVRSFEDNKADQIN